MEDFDELSPKFIQYYKIILVPNYMSESEFDKMIKTFREKLPVVFRIKNNVDQKILDELTSIINRLKQHDIEVFHRNNLPKEFGLIYQINMPQHNFRKNVKTKELKDFINRASELGLIFRQEFVSMIPHHFLNVKPNSHVFDMCAAPGSKTTQIVECLTGEDGFCLSNDVELKRCYNLIHQVNRIGLSKVAVTCQQAQHYYDLDVLFDCVLCDVPCSGDGTIRKSSNIGKSWRTSLGSAYHGLQRSILKRGLELLKVGGTLVYSTCSMNPVENESVIDSVLSEIGDFVEIVDVSNKYCDLKSAPGLVSWPVIIEDCNEFKIYYKSADVPNDYKGQAPHSMFPTGNENLKKCLRFYPHFENSGAFFVAVLKKLKDFGTVTKSVKHKYRPLGEAPFLSILKFCSELVDELRDRFGLEELNFENIFIRNETNAKSIYMLCSPLSSLIDRHTSEKLRMISGGIQVFSKNKSNILYPTLDGAHIINKYMTKNKYSITVDDAKRLLNERHEAIQLHDLSEQINRELEGKTQGGALFYLNGTDFYFPGTIFKNSISFYIRKSDLIKERIRFNYYLSSQ